MAAAARSRAAVLDPHRSRPRRWRRVDEARPEAKTRVAQRRRHRESEAAVAEPENRQYRTPQPQRAALVPWLQYLERAGGQQPDARAVEKIQGQTIRDGTHAAAGWPHHREIREYALSNRHRDAGWKVLSGGRSFSAGDRRR